MSEEFGITDKQFKEAEKRHEDNYASELENVDVRAVVLKTKKALIEQARVSARCEKAAIDQQYEIRALKKRIDGYIYRLEGTEKLLSKQQKVFTEAIALLSKEPQKKKGFFRGFWEFLKCLMK